MGYRFKTFSHAPKLAYQALRLVDPANRDTFPDHLLELGTFRIIENEAAVAAVVVEYVRELAQFSDQVAVDFEQRRRLSNFGDLHRRRLQIQKEMKARAVLSFEDFIRFSGSEQDEEKYDEQARDQRGAKQIRLLARARFAQLQSYGNFNRSFTGYQTYLRAAYKKLFETLSKDLPALVPEEPRRTHTYITSTTKTGKTELLKAICLNYVHQPDHAGVVVLDPGGDMAPQMARWLELISSNQLVYIDPFLSKYHSPVINPFDADGLSDQDCNLLTEQIVLAIASLVEGKIGGMLSAPMEAILYPSVRLLIELPDTSILDLLSLMKDDEKLIAAGCESSDPLIADFFQTEFMKLPSLKITKGSIVTKLRNILGRGVLDKLLCGRTTIDLERLMAERKFIVVNLAKGRLGTSESSALGTLLVSLIQAIAMKRERLPEHDRPMTHLIIDECQNFVTSGIKDIIRETRKFGLAVTLAQQEVGGEMPADLRNVVTKTTNVKVAGRSDSSETKISGELVGVPAEQIAALEAGQFYWKNGTAPPFLLHVRSDRVKTKGGATGDLWLKIMKQQEQRYYAPHDGSLPKDLQDPGDSSPPPDDKPDYIFK